MPTHIKYLIGLNEFNKFGPRSIARLISYFGDAEKAFGASIAELKNAGIRQNIASEFISFRQTININAIINVIQNNNINVIQLGNEQYPKLLSEIYDPPYLLFVLGQMPELENRKSLAIVGARKATQYGIKLAHTLTREIVENNIITVSGLAYGVDQVVHEQTITSGGTTIAVLGHGILHKPPSRQQELHKKIIENRGCIISEFPLYEPGYKTNFPIRNRIISGISNGTLIIEAAEKSGSLITAKSALEQNRDVFAIPGNIDSIYSVGTNILIKNGAHIVTNTQDILDVFDMKCAVAEKSRNTTIKIGDTMEEQMILNILSKSPSNIDEIIRHSNLPTHIIASTISIMELKGLIQNIGAQTYTYA
jgi:DNA processing protein